MMDIRDRWIYKFNLTKIARLRSKGPIPLYIDGKLIKNISKTELSKRIRAHTCAPIPKKLSRFQLAVLVVFNKEIITIQTSFRRKQLIKTNKLHDNDTCPFTLDALESPMFIRTNSSGYRRAFNISMLADYFLINGSTVDPVDKEPFEHEDLVRLDKELKIHGYHKRNISNINCEDAQAMYRQQNENADQIDILIDEIHDYIQRICQLTEYANGLGTSIDDTRDYPCFQLLYEYMLIFFNIDSTKCATVLNGFIEDLEDGTLYLHTIGTDSKEWVISYIRQTLVRVNESNLNTQPDNIDERPWFELTSAQMLPIIQRLDTNLQLLQEHFA